MIKFLCSFGFLLRTDSDFYWFIDSDETESPKGGRSPAADAAVYAHEMGSPYNRSQDAFLSEEENNHFQFTGNYFGMYKSEEKPP